MAMLLDGSKSQSKSPGQSLSDAAVAGYDKGAKNKADKTKADKTKTIPSLKKGGRVKKTGLHLLHKGEEVIPVNKVKSLKRKGLIGKRTSVKA